MRHFLLLDDEINVLHALRRALRQPGLGGSPRLEIHTDPAHALTRAREVAFDLVISDYHMPQMNGVDFLKAVRDIQPDAVRLILSASTDFTAIMTAVNEAEIFRYIVKPWQTVDLEEMVRLALTRRDQLMEDRRLADEVRVQRGELSPQELEMRRLEEQEPGISRVNWGSDGSVLLE